MKPIPLVRANGIFPLIKFLKQAGIPTEKLIKKAKLPIYLLDDPETLISLYHSFIFMENVARSEGIEHLGILAIQQTQLSDFGIFVKIICQSLTLSDFLNQISLLITSNYNSGVRIWLSYKDDLVWFNHQFLNRAKVNNQQANYYVCINYLKVIEMAIAAKLNPVALHFQADQLPGLENFELFSETKVYFNQPNNAIAFPKSLLMLPIKHRCNNNLYHHEQSYEILKSSAPAIDFTDSLKQLIKEQLKGGYFDIKLAAEAAGMSPRSLQRRLDQESLSYSRLIEQIRFDLAMTWLEDPDIQLNDLAFELGYTKPANFTRAFKRWVGVSPSEFRRLQML
jgi:AraC-like DNA-binding protein